MSRTVDLILYLLAFVCFVLAALDIALPRVNAVALGLAFWVLVPLGTIALG